MRRVRCRVFSEGVLALMEDEDDQKDLPIPCTRCEGGATDRVSLVV
jgi:hypothetical protein